MVFITYLAWEEGGTVWLLFVKLISALHKGGVTGPDAPKIQALPELGWPPPPPPNPGILSDLAHNIV